MATVLLMLLLTLSLLTDVAELRLERNAEPRTSRGDHPSHSDLPLAIEDRDEQVQIEATSGDP